MNSGYHKDKDLSYQFGFIRLGSVLFVLLLLIILRVYWGIDISEHAKEVFRELNNITGAVIDHIKALYFRYF
ncbi:MAG: hypothetical protein ACQEP6_02855 [Patescibacteria group bacterium]